MELSQLETFLAVAEERSFSRAALRLHRTQPAVSQVIRKLEDVGGRDALRPRRPRWLADRGRRPACATTRCACWPCAARPPAPSDELKSLERGHLQLAANEYTCMYLLPAIDAFRREFPHVSVTVQRMLASHIPEELNLRTFELGVISFRPDPGAVPHHRRLRRQPGLHRQPASPAGRRRARLHQRPGQ